MLLKASCMSAGGALGAGRGGPALVADIDFDGAAGCADNRVDAALGAAVNDDAACAAINSDAALVARIADDAAGFADNRGDAAGFADIACTAVVAAISIDAALVARIAEDAAFSEVLPSAVAGGAVLVADIVVRLSSPAVPE